MVRTRHINLVFSAHVTEAATPKQPNLQEQPALTNIDKQVIGKSIRLLKLSPLPSVPSSSLFAGRGGEEERGGGGEGTLGSEGLKNWAFALWTAS